MRKTVFFLVAISAAAMLAVPPVRAGGGEVVMPGAATAAAAAQIPSTFTNLDVVPSDISRDELVGIMRNFASALGVRCDHCHVGDNPDTLEGFDFAYDEKETKRVARAMMRMVGEINGSSIPATGRNPAGLLEVGCVTCHHGATRPQTLPQVLGDALEEGGADAAVARYRELRDEYYEAIRYLVREVRTSPARRQADCPHLAEAKLT